MLPTPQNRCWAVGHPLNKLAFESEVMSLGRGSWRNLSTEG
ncbi:Uncharacterised protein [Vibrio cholerae]|nr:Uncharacterised protein [Vibrio cholerae]